MSGPIVYVDHSAVREGRLEELEEAITGLVALVDANEDRILAYDVYFTADGERMSVVHIHRDSASLRRHMEVAGPAFGRFGELIDLLSIDVYGDVDEEVAAQLRAKAALLGNATVTIQRRHAGLDRFLDG